MNAKPSSFTTTLTARRPSPALQAALALLAVISLPGCNQGQGNDTAATDQALVEATQADDIAPFRADFYQSLVTKAVQASAAAQGMTNPLPLDTGSAGQFPFIWENDALDFSLNTYDFINTLVQLDPAPGTSGSAPGLSLQTDTVSNATDSLYRTLTYQLSSSDEATLHAAKAAADDDIQVLEMDWSSTFGPIPAQAPPSTKLDYIFAQVLTWSSQSITLRDLQQAENLGQLLDKAPASGEELMPQVAAVLQSLGSSVDLQDQVTHASFVLEHLETNTEHPSADNGGMTTVDDTGHTTLHVGYAINRSVADIESDLENTSSSVQISMSASKTDETTMKVSLEGGGGILVDIEEFFGEGEGSASAHIFSSSGSGTDVQISVSYDGLSVVPIAPTVFEEDTLQGWLSTHPLEQAHGNGVLPATPPTSGYYWRDAPTYELGRDYGVLSELLISNYPTISITYTNGDYSTFQTEFEEQSEACITFLFIPLACGEQSTYASSLSAKSEDGSFTVTYAPSTGVVASSAAQLDKRAYVIAASATWPGVDDSGH